MSRLLETLAGQGPGPDPERDRETADNAQARRAEDVAALIASHDGGRLTAAPASVSSSTRSCWSDEEAPGSAATQVLGLTLHAAKGLEFDTVVIVGAEEGLLPHYRHTIPEALAEERRLCYVGMTRARERLVLSVARMRHLWGDVVFRPPSRFLREAGLDRRPATATPITTTSVEVSPS